LLLLGCFSGSRSTSPLLVVSAATKDTEEDAGMTPPKACPSGGDVDVDVDIDGACVANDRLVRQQELMDWMRSHNAILNPKQTVQLVDPTGAASSSSPYGVFATSNIAKGEIIISVPEHLIVSGNIQTGDEFELPCETVDLILKEMEKGDTSFYAPYMRYLQSIPEGELPEAWSGAGRKLLTDLMGGDDSNSLFNGQHWLNKWNGQVCDGINDPEGNRAALLVANRMEDGQMIPYLDFFNHRNGHSTNADSAVNAETDSFMVVAKRNIREGEQIYMSRNMCFDCTHFETNGYGTPELLRDHGFVEDLPQRWNFNLAGKRRVFDLLERRSGELEIEWVRSVPPKKGTEEQVGEHLQFLDEFAQKHSQNTGDVPENEWNIIMKYHNALTQSHNALLKNVRGSNHLQEHEDDMPVLDEHRVYWDRYEGCFDEGHYVEIDPFKLEQYEDCEDSIFQSLCYGEDPHQKNKCFDLDGHIQMCADHRPHYHEPFVHFTTSFLKDLKRVAFVGGGDNMILHEVLKYPTVEFVIGLELDQKCVRKSFKHFHTQPLFEDEKVQWWFGDATKSLTMLPKEYFGSFDLVLVDLSETATSLTVTDHLDMFEALSLLVKPDGIFVKNEIYIEKLSTLFDHTVTLYEDHIPMVCKQDFTMGSNRIDFLSPNFELTKKYKPETYVYKPLEDINTHYRILKDYSKNDARAQGNCEKLDANIYDSDEQRRAGIVMIVEAEDATGASMPAEKMEETLRKAITRSGASPLSSIAQPSEHGGAVVIISMKQGYVVAHSWPEHNYVGLEIHLWSQFVQLETIKSSLLEAVGSTTGPWSTYRIVAGGMLGTDNWKEEQATIGPRPIESRNCDPINSSGPDKTTIGIVMEEGLSLIEKKEDTTVLVLCGDNTKDSCKSLDAFKNKGIKNLVAVWSCPEAEMEGSNGLEMKNGVDSIVLCGSVDSTEWLVDIVKKYGMIGFIAVDPDAARTVVRSLTSLVLEESETHEDDILTDNAITVVPLLGESHKHQKALVQARRQRRVVDEYAASHEVTVGPLGTGMKIWFSATRHPAFLSHVADVASSIKSRAGIDAAVTANLLDITADIPPYDGYVGTMDDYETLPGLLQFSNQLPLGLQSLYQFEYKNQAPLSATQLKGALELALTKIDVQVSASEISSEAGDGALIYLSLTAGHAIVLWDGGVRVDTNLFTYDETIEHKDVFAEAFMDALKGLEYVLRDEMPRGTGHVVNSMEEIGTRTPGCFDRYQWCSIYAGKGKCEADKSWMTDNCLKSCGLC